MGRMIDDDSSENFDADTFGRQIKGLVEQLNANGGDIERIPDDALRDLGLSRDDAREYARQLLQSEEESRFELEEIRRQLAEAGKRMENTRVRLEAAKLKAPMRDAIALVIAGVKRESWAYAELLQPYRVTDNYKDLVPALIALGVNISEWAGKDDDELLEYLGEVAKGEAAPDGSADSDDG